MLKLNGFTSDFTGLTQNEVKKSQEIYGKNELMPEKKKTLLSKIFNIFKEPMFLLLFCTALIYFLLREYRDGIIMLCFVTFMSGINFFQEWRTDKTLEELKDLSAPRVRVIREDALISIDSKDLAVGDLMLVEEGEKISADGKIIEMYDLGIDESSLTGESETVWKNLNGDEGQNHWKRDFCYSGTTVIQGRAIVKVTETGQNTEYGKIGVDIVMTPDRPTPIEKQTRRLVKISALFGLVFFLLVLLFTYINCQDIIKSLLAGITLAMAIIPEEFPVILTVFLAMGAWRLAKKNTLIRRMTSVETLGAVSVLCVDKTGTLTQNKMTVQKIFTFGNIDNDLIYHAVLACEPEPFDPMEKAILEYAKDCGLNYEEMFNKPLIYEYPFNNDTKMMGHIWSIEGKNILCAKGSPESILPLCRLNGEDMKSIEEEQLRLAEEGYRVIAVAIIRDVSEIAKELKENELDFLGLIALMDPPRDAVPNALKVCAKAGIRVVMITGDNGTTAKSIAQKIGILNSDNIITGIELDNMRDGELFEKVKNTNIFARVIPKHKTRIVKALKDIGEIVAMTGDGVNDAPALKNADIGIAMGKRGTGVAKEAADMILLDDNFTTIVDTIKDGRRIYDNIKKAIGYVFVIHIPIALIALMTPLLKLPLFLYPVHVVLFELIVDPTCSIIFERQPPEADIMDRKPRNTKESIVNMRLMTKALLQGLVIFAATFGAYHYFLTSGGGTYEAETAARTIALLTFVLSNLFLVYVNQSRKEFALFSMIKYKDKVKWSVNIAVIIGMALLIYTPYGNVIAKTHPLEPIELLISLGLAVAATFWWEIVKILKRIFNF